MLSRFDEPPRPDQPLIVILSDDTDEEDHNVLFPALRDRGTSVIRVHPHELVVNIRDRVQSFSAAGLEFTPDLVVGWVLEDLLFPGMAHLEAFAAAGVPVINSALTLFRAQNKYVTSAHLAAERALGYPVITGRDPVALRSWMAEFGGPAVTKPVFGFGGRGLQRADTAADLQPVLTRVEQSGENYYAMPWVQNPGRDIRVYTVNHHAVFAMYRYAPAGQWVTNVKAGGQIAMCPLTEDISALASRASRAVGTLIGGVDIGEDTATGELVVYEVNSCPTCEPPVLLAAADFLAAAARDVDAAVRTWRPAKVYDGVDDDPALFHPSKHGLIRQR